MTLERLHYFVTAAELLNFTKAAERCHIAQTAMSRQIAMVEEEIGCPLFLREHRSVSLTEAGEAFYQDVAPLLWQYQRTLERIRSIERGGGKKLYIGIGQYEQGFVSGLIERFHCRYPDVEVTIFQYNYADLVNRLLVGVLDLIFVLPVIADYLVDKGADIHKLFATQSGVVVRQEDPLAQKTAIDGEDFAGRTVITISEMEGPCSLSGFLARMTGRGWHYDRVVQVNSLQAALVMIRAGVGLMLAPIILQKELPGGLRIIPLRPEASPPENFVVANLTDSRNPMVRQFLKEIGVFERQEDGAQCH